MEEKRLTGLSQHLRKEMTKEERHLWYDFLRHLPVTVKRQKVIGNYIADFYVAQARLIIELDGSQHYTEEGEKHDKERDEFFEKRGIKVFRYTNRQIHERFDDICADILFQIEKRQKSLPSFRER